MRSAISISKKQEQAMKKIDTKCWEHKGYTVFYDNSSVHGFPYRVYDDQGFDLEAFSSFDECREFIDSLE